MPPKKNIFKGIVSSIFVMTLVYITFATIYAVYDKEFTLDLFSKGRYKGLVVTLLGTIVYAIGLLIWYRIIKKRNNS